MQEQVVDCTGFRLSESRNGVEAGHAYLYIMYNDLHKEPFGLLEDDEVNEVYKGQGVGRKLLSVVLLKARELGCYKLVATSRDDGTRDPVHAWYKRLGFIEYGKEFRLDL